MKTLTKTLAKGTIAAVAAGAMAMASAAPAQAQYSDSNRDRGGIGVGEIIAGALIIGGIAAVASASSNRNRGSSDGYAYEGRGYNGNGYNGYNQAGDSRQAVEQCVYAAERNASRYSRAGAAQVTDIRNIVRKRDGYTVKGRIAVNTGNANWQRGWNNDYRGYNNNQRGYDAGNFTCKVRHGRVADLDYSGIRGL